MQLGSGAGSSYPNAIDSRQVYVNGPTPAPDSDSRVDAELVNDSLATLLALETVLGANPNGTYGSVAARLNAFLPGGGGLPGVFTFTNALTVAIPGTMHNVGQAALLFHLYDANVPANAMAVGSYQIEVDPATYDVFLTFATPTSGLIAIGATGPLYLASFTSTSTVSVLGTTHQLGTSDLLFQVYDNATPRHNAIQPGALTVHPTTHDVVCTFGMPLSGVLVLSAGSPTYALSFTNVSTLAIPGSVHLLGTRAILFQFYDAATPRAAMGEPGVTVNPTTFDMHVTFVTPTSGRLVLAPASTVTGQEFEIRDAGVVNVNAVRMRSLAGNLHLQAGLAQHVYFEDKLGASKMTLETITGLLGIGTSVPTHQLELSTGDAVKLGGGPWNAPSDVRQKEDIRPFTEGLEALLQLEPVRFRYNGLGGLPRTTQEFVGLVAQQVQTILPSMIQRRRGRLRPEDEDTDLLTLDLNPLVYLLINAVKALYALVLEGRQQRRRLEQQMALLAGRCEALTAPRTEEES